MAPSEEQKQNGFEAWTEGTISSAANGHPTFFHATPVQFEQFASFQHFGTPEAAAARAKARPSLNHVTHEVWLAIRNPMQTFDDEAANNVSRLAVDACTKGRIDEATRDRILDRIEGTQRLWYQHGDYNVGKWQYSMEVFTQELAELGYDGLVYPNTVEGGLSYVPFTGDQIWWVTREAPEA